MHRASSLSSPRSLPGIEDNASQSTRGSRRVEFSVGQISRSLEAASRPCNCRNTFRRQSHLQSFFGDLFFGYIATPIIKQHAPGCQRYAQAGFVLAYSFPEWFLHYILAVRAHFNASTGVRCSLSFRPLLGSEHPVWTAVSHGDIEQLKSLFNSRQASFEVQSVDFYGLLAVSGWQTTFTQGLIISTSKV